MEKSKYLKPCMEQYQLRVEQGFAGSPGYSLPESGGDDGDGFTDTY